LDGSASSDVDGDALTFQWTPVAWPEGLPPVLANPASVNPGLTLARAGAYTVQLIVNDGRVDSAPDSVTVSTENARPVAEAGPAQTVPLNATVQLNGAGSRDADGDPLTYQWTLTSAPGALPTVQNSTTVNPTFVASQPGEYVAQLIVNDGKVNSDPDTVTVSTENSKPVADAGPDQAAETGQTVILNGVGIPRCRRRSVDLSVVMDPPTPREQRIAERSDRGRGALCARSRRPIHRAIDRQR
ncbi:MAG: PKD domain-containing protein, partial [Candidatus Competibacteraceae bacterium]